jgi:hypothetical protein
MLKSSKLKAAAIASVFVAMVPRIANACATCGLSDGDQALHAYKASVLFMLASPYISFAAIGGVTYFVYRRAHREDQDSTRPTITKH